MGAEGEISARLALAAKLPATARQVDFLRKFGVTAPETMTRREAAEWLRRLHDSGWKRAQP